MRTRIVAILLLALVSSAGAENLKGDCDIRFLGTSTLHDFAGTVRCQPFPLNVAGGADGRRFLSGVEIAVPVEEMDTKNRKRDKQMQEMFESDRFPHIRAVLSALDPDKIRQEMRKDAHGKGTVEITLKIREIEQRIQATVSNLRETPGRVSFDVEFPVSLKTYNLKPPSPFFGAIRVGDKIAVNAAFRLETESTK
jgi:hypothetical protein